MLGRRGVFVGRFKLRVASAVVTLALLAGCRTASFAPPPVEMNTKLLAVPQWNCVQWDKFSQGDVVKGNSGNPVAPVRILENQTGPRAVFSG